MDYFPGEAIYRGNSQTSKHCIALERLDGKKGKAQHSWWNFDKNGIYSLELVKAKRGRPAKVKTAQYLLQYELETDPVEEFADLKDVKERLQELAKNKDLKRDKIFLYEIKNKVKVELEDRITIKGI